MTASAVWRVLERGGLWEVYLKHFSIPAYIEPFLKNTPHNSPHSQTLHGTGRGNSFSEPPESRDLTGGRRRPRVKGSRRKAAFGNIRKLTEVDG